MLNFFGNEPRLVNYKQGSDEWHKHRAEHFNASDAGAMMGVSPFKSRNDLLRELKTGEKKKVTDFQQQMFDLGHEVEAIKRKEFELDEGVEFYPVTVRDSRYSASMDGVNVFDGSNLGWEHKYCAKSDKNYELALQGEIPEHYRWQLDHQIMVSGVERIAFWVTRNDRQDTAKIMYQRNDDRIKQLLGAWEDFAIELEHYEASEEIAQVATEAPYAMPVLPAITANVFGEVKDDTVDLYYKESMNFLSKVNRSLKTDQDYVDADEVIKFCKENEKRVETAKDAILMAVPDIGYLMSTLELTADEFRTVRLDLNKKVVDRKNAIKDVMVAVATEKSGDDSNYDRLKRCIKNKRTTKSVQQALDAELAKIKSEPPPSDPFSDGFLLGLSVAQAVYMGKRLPMSKKKLAEKLGLNVKEVESTLAKVADSCD